MSPHGRICKSSVEISIFPQGRSIREVILMQPLSAIRVYIVWYIAICGEVGLPRRCRLARHDRLYSGVHASISEDPQDLYFIKDTMNQGCPVEDTPGIVQGVLLGGIAREI